MDRDSARIVCSKLESKLVLGETKAFNLLNDFTFSSLEELSDSLKIEVIEILPVKVFSRSRKSFIEDENDCCLP